MQCYDALDAAAINIAQICGCFAASSDKCGIVGRHLPSVFIYGRRSRSGLWLCCGFGLSPCFGFVAPVVRLRHCKLKPGQHLDASQTKRKSSTVVSVTCKSLTMQRLTTLASITTAATVASHYAHTHTKSVSGRWPVASSKTTHRSNRNNNKN